LGVNRIGMEPSFPTVFSRSLLSEKLHHKDAYPLLSCADIENLLAHFLPRRDVTEEEVIFQLEQRHRQRQKAIESHARCQERRLE